MVELDELVEGNRCEGICDSDECESSSKSRSYSIPLGGGSTGRAELVLIFEVIVSVIICEEPADSMRVLWLLEAICR